MAYPAKKVICYLSASAGDWGGASRVLFTTLGILNKEKYEPLVLLPKEGPILAKLQDLKISFKIWGGLHEPCGRLNYIKDILHTMRFFRKNAVRIIHINHANYWRPAEIIAAKILRIPIITHYHVVVKEPGPYIRFSSRIAAVSKFVVESSGPKKIPKRVIYNSVDLTRFDNAKDIRKELGVGKEDIVISFVGQIREIKGIDLFLQLTKRITDEKVKFIIAGECRDPKRFSDSYTEERLQREIGRNKKVKYIGYTLEVQNIYYSSDIIVMPSRWAEPFGLINIEAGAACKPIVSTRVGGIPEVIRHGENGYLVEKEDIDSMIGYVEKLISNPLLRTKMGNKARQLIEEYFTHQPVKDLENMYEELMN